MRGRNSRYRRRQDSSAARAVKSSPECFAAVSSVVLDAHASCGVVPRLTNIYYITRNGCLDAQELGLLDGLRKECPRASGEPCSSPTLPKLAHAHRSACVPSRCPSRAEVLTKRTTTLRMRSRISTCSSSMVCCSRIGALRQPRPTCWRLRPGPFWRRGVTVCVLLAGRWKKSRAG